MKRKKNLSNAMIIMLALLAAFVILGLLLSGRIVIHENPTESPATYQAFIKQPSYCYNGPGDNYTSLSKIIPARTVVDILGKNSDGADWFMIQAFLDRCWIKEEFLDYNEENIKNILTLVTKYTTIDSLCYLGPGDNYDIKTNIPRGWRIVINGRDNLQPGWFLVTPHDSTEQCWVAVVGFLLTDAEMSSIPTVSVIPFIPSATMAMTPTIDQINFPTIASQATLTPIYLPVELTWKVVGYDCSNGFATGALIDLNISGGKEPYRSSPTLPVYVEPGQVVSITVFSGTSDGEPSKSISFVVPRASDISIFKCDGSSSDPKPTSPPNTPNLPTNTPKPPQPPSTPIPPTPIPPTPTLCWPPGHCK
jgi:hypothetical protein